MGDLKPFLSHPPLNREQRRQLVVELRSRANRQPGLSPEQRQEARRVANNLHRVVDSIERRRAQRNQHPQHPTRQ